ncbi:MAG: hypothetical protein JWO61_182 [Candidatus Saccharibacteria bacterium]|nr:hypothetical protein [Candidatus Saccharibacteria bacterium]
MVDIQPTNQQSSSDDDQELAKVLAGVSAQADNTPLVADEPIVTTPFSDSTPAAEEAAVVSEEPVAPVELSYASPAPVMPPSASGDGDLESIKKDAIVALRPLVDKLELAPEEKFDTYLLLLRSTDDKALIAPANEAAKSISDETRRAQALLDIIKEIDYLSGQPAA